MTHGPRTDAAGPAPLSLRAARPALAGLAAAYFMIGASSLATVGMVEEMRADLGVSAAALAALLTVFAAVYAVAAPLMQARLGAGRRRVLMVSGLGLMSASCALTALAQDYAPLAGARVLGALGAALLGPTISATAAGMVAPQDRGAALAAAFSGLTIATVVGVPLSSWLAQTVGWRTAWWLLAAGAAVAALAIWRLTPRGLSGARVDLRAILGLIGDRLVGPIVAVTALQACGQFATYGLLALWFTEAAGLPVTLVPLGLLLYGIGGVAGNALSPRLERALGTAGAVQASLAGMAAAVTVLWLVPGSAWVALGGGMIWAAFGLAYVAPVQGLMVRIAGARGPLALALNSSALYVGMAAGSALAGAIHASFGAASMPPATVALVLASLLLFRLVAARARAGGGGADGAA